jgi:hypothetical protein
MTGWADLAAELDRWGAAGHRATLWWRDDDAVTATPQLFGLLRLAEPVPLALAVIPGFARPELADAFERRTKVVVLQHGWRHIDRSAAGGKKSEYPAGRLAEAVGAEIDAGKARLQTLFGKRAVSVFVPPWNRMADVFLTLLPTHGIAAVSALAGRRDPATPTGLGRIDVDLDLVDWRNTRGFVGEAAALGRLIGCLEMRRAAGLAERPIGLLTHHLIMDQATAVFLARLIDVVAVHPAAHWAAATDLL